MEKADILRILNAQAVEVLLAKIAEDIRQRYQVSYGNDYILKHFVNEKIVIDIMTRQTDVANKKGPIKRRLRKHHSDS